MKKHSLLALVLTGTLAYASSAFAQLQPGTYQSAWGTGRMIEIAPNLSVARYMDSRNAYSFGTINFDATGAARFFSGRWNFEAVAENAQGCIYLQWDNNFANSDVLCLPGFRAKPTQVYTSVWNTGRRVEIYKDRGATIARYKDSNTYNWAKMHLGRFQSGNWTFAVTDQRNGCKFMTWDNNAQNADLLCTPGARPQGFTTYASVRGTGRTVQIFNGIGVHIARYVDAQTRSWGAVSTIQGRSTFFSGSWSFELIQNSQSCSILTWDHNPNNQDELCRR